MNNLSQSPSQNLMDNFSKEVRRYLKEYKIKYAEWGENYIKFDQGGYRCKITFKAHENTVQ